MHAESHNTAEKPQISPAWSIGDLLITYLKQLKVDYVFGIPGGAIEPFYDALARSEKQNGPRSIVTRHETSSAFMADGYSMQTGKLGVCCATTGPGATNLITGVATAYANRVPLLVITAQTALNTFGRNAFQESSCTGVNTLGMFEHCTLYNTLVSHPDQLEHKLMTAILTAFGPPSGPVHLSIPIDVMRAPASPTQPHFDISSLLEKPDLIDFADIDKLTKILITEKPAVFVIGEGASESIGTILSVARLINARIITTPHGKGLVSPYHPQYRGVIGFAGHKSAVATLQDPHMETVICIGTTLGEWASNGWDENLLLNGKLIHIDEQPANFAQSPMARLHIHGRIVAVFEHLYNRLQRTISPLQHSKSMSRMPSLKGPRHSMMRHFSLDDETGYADTTAPIKPQSLMRELPRLFPPNARYLADTGASFAWAIHYLHPFDRRMAGARNARGGLFRACLEFAPMGWAIGCAVGTSLANPTQPVVCITGDGSWLMNGQEITVAVQEQLPIIFVILNDSSLGMVKHGQRLTGAQSVGTEMAFTDFAAMARSMGAQSYIINSPGDLKYLDGEALCTHPGPTLLDVRIDPEAVPPIGARIKVLKENV